jgi:hypothetical protein
MQAGFVALKLALVWIAAIPLAAFLYVRMIANAVFIARDHPPVGSTPTENAGHTAAVGVYV